MTVLDLDNTVHNAVFNQLYRDYRKELSQYSNRLRNEPVTEEELSDIKHNSELNVYLIIEAQQEIIGFCLVGFGKNTHPATDYYIAELYVSPPYRGRGCAKKAVSELLNTYPGIYCYFVINNNKRAQVFWRNITTALNCLDLSNSYDAAPYTPSDCTFYAFEYVKKQNSKECENDM